MRVVEGIQHIEPELESLAFRQAKLFLEAQIPVLIARATDVANAARTKRSGSRCRNVAGVKPLYVGSLASRSWVKLVKDLDGASATWPF